MHIDRSRLARLRAEEAKLFEELHPRSAELAHEASRSLLSGVPMPWMTRWPGSFPLTVASATGSRFVDVDGIEYDDFWLGDTGARTGHGLSVGADALHAQAKRGITTMLPSADATWVADELARRFGLPKWQMALSATDANRFVLRLARMLTGRPKICVMDWCYHGTVDETLAILGPGGDVVSRPGAIGPQVDPALTTKVVPFNDVAALESALADGDVACVLMEPALTNIGIVLPKPGYLDEVRRLTRSTGTLLVIDETHTICAGPGGCTVKWGLEPDFFVIGKPIGGGMPSAAYGMSGNVAATLESILGGDDVDVSGIGGTLTGNALSLAAVRATLSSTLRAEDFERMVPLAQKWTDGVRQGFQSVGLDWHVQRLGCRAEYWFCPPPTSGAEAAAAVDHELDAFMHLYALNRGILMTPFHNMALFSPAHTVDQVDRHTAVFGSAVRALTGN
ncbi:MAG: aspartate aminotransferase family protein [Ilumatobacteraceae bacterium]